MIKLPRSVIPACDVPLDKYEEIVKETSDVEKIGGYKVGFKLMLDQGLPELDLDENTVYNHCSGSTDIPAIGAKMMEALKARPEITGVILTPLSGPVTKEAWIKAAKERGLEVYLEPFLDIKSFFVSGGGYVEDGAKSSMLSPGFHQIDGYILPDNELGYDLANVLLKKVYFRTGKGVEGLNELKSFDVMAEGLKKVVDNAREFNDKPIIYDHQKAGTSLPEYAGTFAKTCKSAGVDIVIFFPQAGPEAQDAYTKEARDQGLGVIIGGLMTHPGYSTKEGGYISGESGLSIYERAAKDGFNKLVVPGNRLDTILQILDVMYNNKVIPSVFAPGFVVQKGVLSKAVKAYAEQVVELFKIPISEVEFHAIVGRGVYQAENIKKAALMLTSKL